MRFVAIAILQTLYTVSVLGLAIYGFQALFLTLCTLMRLLYSGSHENRRIAEGNARLIQLIQRITHHIVTYLHMLPPLRHKHPNQADHLPIRLAPAAIIANKTSTTPATLPIATWPKVTVQLPIYNERHVIERLINACAQLDYPQERLQIQVLDDSDDYTTTLAARAIEVWQQQGVNITLVRRPTRTGYKAGALAHGLASATGEYIAIFDADFVPQPTFLRELLPCFYASDLDISKQSEPETEDMEPIASTDTNKIGFVQARWSHLNAGYSALTNAQALALDGHFVVEQGGRQWIDFAMGFNGSGGIWHRSCIEDSLVGGWQADTLCEDLDLSYRAQLAGWKPYYRNDVEAPAEVPPQLIAFKRQQFRWAKGSIQTLRKLGKRVWHSHWPLPKRLAALAHLGSYLIHPLLLLLLLTSLPLLLLGANPGTHIALLSLASLGPPLLYALGQRVLYGRSWWHRWRYLPFLTLIGTGICFSNTRAVIQGLRNNQGAFLRTPKFHVEERADRWVRSNYRLPIDGSLLGELCCFLYSLLTVIVAFRSNNWMYGSYLLLYVGGFGLMIAISLWQARPLFRPRRSRPTSSQQSHRPLSP